MKRRNHQRNNSCLKGVNFHSERVHGEYNTVGENRPTPRHRIMKFQKNGSRQMLL